MEPDVLLMLGFRGERNLPSLNRWNRMYLVRLNGWLVIIWRGKDWVIWRSPNNWLTWSRNDHAMNKQIAKEYRDKGIVPLDVCTFLPGDTEPLTIKAVLMELTKLRPNKLTSGGNHGR